MLSPGPLSIERVSKADIAARKLNTSWVPHTDHPSIPENLKGPELSKSVTLNLLDALNRGSWEVSDEWNKLLPHFKFTGVEEFLREIWADKP